MSKDKDKGQSPLDSFFGSGKGKKRSPKPKKRGAEETASGEATNSSSVPSKKSKTSAAVQGKANESASASNDRSTAPTGRPAEGRERAAPVDGQLQEGSGRGDGANDDRCNVRSDGACAKLAAKEGDHDAVGDVEGGAAGEEEENEGKDALLGVADPEQGAVHKSTAYDTQDSDDDEEDDASMDLLPHLSQGNAGDVGEEEEKDPSCGGINDVALSLGYGHDGAAGKPGVVQVTPMNKETSTNLGVWLGRLPSHPFANKSKKGSTVPKAGVAGLPSGESGKKCAINIGFHATVTPSKAAAEQLNSGVVETTSMSIVGRGNEEDDAEMEEFIVKQRDRAVGEDHQGRANANSSITHAGKKGAKKAEPKDISSDAGTSGKEDTGTRPIADPTKSMLVQRLPRVRGSRHARAGTDLSHLANDDVDFKVGVTIVRPDGTVEPYPNNEFVGDFIEMRFLERDGSRRLFRMPVVANAPEIRNNTPFLEKLKQASEFYVAEEKDSELEVGLHVDVHDESNATMASGKDLAMAPALGVHDSNATKTSGSSNARSYRYCGSYLDSIADEVTRSSSRCNQLAWDESYNANGNALPGRRNETSAPTSVPPSASESTSASTVSEQNTIVTPGGGTESFATSYNATSQASPEAEVDDSITMRVSGTSRAPDTLSTEVEEGASEDEQARLEEQLKNEKGFSKLPSGNWQLRVYIKGKRTAVGAFEPKYAIAAKYAAMEAVRSADATKTDKEIAAAAKAAAQMHVSNAKKASIVKTNEHDETYEYFSIERAGVGAIHVHVQSKESEKKKPTNRGATAGKGGISIQLWVPPSLDSVLKPVLSEAAKKFREDNPHCTDRGWACDQIAESYLPRAVRDHLGWKEYSPSGLKKKTAVGHNQKTDFRGSFFQQTDGKWSAQYSHLDLVVRLRNGEKVASPRLGGVIVWDEGSIVLHPTPGESAGASQESVVLSHLPYQKGRGKRKTGESSGCALSSCPCPFDCGKDMRACPDALMHFMSNECAVKLLDVKVEDNGLRMYFDHIEGKRKLLTFSLGNLPVRFRLARHVHASEDGHKIEEELTAHREYHNEANRRYYADEERRLRCRASLKERRVKKKEAELLATAKQVEEMEEKGDFYHVTEEGARDEAVNDGIKVGQEVLQSEQLVGVYAFDCTLDPKGIIKNNEHINFCIDHNRNSLLLKNENGVGVHLELGDFGLKNSGALIEYEVVHLRPTRGGSASVLFEKDYISGLEQVLSRGCLLNQGYYGPNTDPGGKTICAAAMIKLLNLGKRLKEKKVGYSLNALESTKTEIATFVPEEFQNWLPLSEEIVARRKAEYEKRKARHAARKKENAMSELLSE